MKKHYKIVSVVLCAVMLLSLCACGNGNTQDSAGANKQNIFDSVDNIAPEDRPVKPADLEYTVSEYLATGETIWYMISDYEGKDSNVVRIYVINPDGTLYTMSGSGNRLGELEQMDDADIAAMVKAEHVSQLISSERLLEQDEKTYCDNLRGMFPDENLLYYVVFAEGSELPLYAESFVGGNGNDSLTQEASLKCVDFLQKWQTFVRKYERDMDMERLLAYMNALRVPQDAFAEALEKLPLDESGIEALTAVSAALNSLCKTYYDHAAAETEAFLEAAQHPFPYKLVIITDSTGNNTDYMELVYNKPNINGTASVRTVELSYFYPAGNNRGNSTMVVYDSVYGGYHSDGEYLFTRVSSNVHFMLDAVGTYDLPIDIKSYDELFE